MDLLYLLHQKTSQTINAVHVVQNLVRATIRIEIVADQAAVDVVHANLNSKEEAQLLSGIPQNYVWRKNGRDLSQTSLAAFS